MKNSIARRSFAAAALAALMIAAFVSCSKKTAAVVTPSGAEAGDQSDWIELNLSYATYLPEANPNQGNVQSLQYHLDKYMPGKIHITTYAGGSLLAQNDIYQGLLDGVADLGFVDLGSVPERFPLSQLFVYPGMTFNSSENGSRTLMEWIDSEQPAEYNDIVVWAASVSGPLGLLANKPVRTLTDAKGMQVRASAVAAKTVQSWGALPVTLPLSEVYEGMRSGLLDGNYNYIADAAKNKFYEVASNMTIMSLSCTAYFYGMNKDVFNRMPPSQREVFKKAAREAWENYGAAYQDISRQADPDHYYPGMDDIDPDMVPMFKKINFYFLDPGTKNYEDFKKASETLQGEYVKTLDAKGLDGTGQLAKIKAIADKYNAKFSWDDYKKLLLSNVSNERVENP